ncbi:superoxide dismutase [Vibrio cholerae]|nr:superoxide dismutase [Vibrio cholerae]TYA83741.1 superoxide dismutase [Vibrio cholerae]
MQLVCLSLVVMRCQPLRRALCSRWITTHHQLFLIAHSYHIMLYIML